MGCVLSCCQICLLGCAPKTLISLDISKNISSMIDEYINKMKDITFTMPPAWSPNITKDKDLIKYLSKQILLALKSITNFKPYSFNGFTDEYITVNLSYYLIHKMFDNDYEFNTLDNIPIDTCFYKKPNIPEESKNRFITNLELFPTKTISLTSNDSTDKLLLDIKLKKILTSAINNTDFDAIILVIYNEFLDKVEQKNAENLEALTANTI
jgi:hypothetical protein